MRGFMQNIEIPKIGSTWLHKKGNLYIVTSIANLVVDEGKQDEYPISIHYMRVSDGLLFERRLTRWHESFTKASRGGVND